MSVPTLRVVTDPIADEAVAWSRQVQLSLFDRPTERRLLCLPMLELHGETFQKLVVLHRPAIVVDLRSRPFFDRPALNRAIAFDLFGRSSASYLHRALDLRPPRDQQAMWRMRSAAIEVFDVGLGGLPASADVVVAALLSHGYEIPVLEQAMRSVGGDEGAWRLVHGAELPR